jgi:hypothetical protein
MPGEKLSGEIKCRGKFAGCAISREAWPQNAGGKARREGLTKEGKCGIMGL